MMNITGFIAIKQPCHEGWENMSVSEKGKFCSSCQKQVHDFSNASLHEMKAAYHENNGDLCGHFPARVLQEQYVEKELVKGHFSFMKKFFMAALFCFGASLFNIDAAKASSLYKLKLSFLNLKPEANDTITVKGMIKDRHTREPIPFVIISVMYNDSVIAHSSTDFDGAYTVRIPKEFSKVSIKAVYVGYQTHIIKNVSISPNKQIVVDIDIQMEEQMLDGIMIMDEQPIIKNEPGPSGKTIKRKEFKNMPK